MTTPKLPSVRELARELRYTHCCWCKPGRIGNQHVSLRRDGPDVVGWLTLLDDGYGSEPVPLTPGAPFDATAAARRLLSDARLAMKGMR